MPKWSAWVRWIWKWNGPWTIVAHLVVGDWGSGIEQLCCLFKLLSAGDNVGWVFLITWDCCIRDCGKFYGTFYGSGYSFMYIQITSIDIERNLPLEASVTNQEVIDLIHNFPDPPSLICCQPWWLLLHKFLSIRWQSCMPINMIKAVVKYQTREILLGCSYKAHTQAWPVERNYRGRYRVWERERARVLRIEIQSQFQRWFPCITISMIFSYKRGCHLWIRTWTKWRLGQESQPLDHGLEGCFRWSTTCGDPWSNGPRLPILAEVGITGSQWCPTTVDKHKHMTDFQDMIPSGLS
jgi:hypothetical protein